MKTLAGTLVLGLDDPEGTTDSFLTYQSFTVKGHTA